MANKDKNSEIDAAMTVLDIVHRHRETEAVFKKYDALANDCIMCNALFDDLSTVCEKYGLSLEDLVRDLENAAP